MDSEIARGRVSKLLHEVAVDLELDLIVKTLILLQWIYLETVSFIGFPRSSYRDVICFSAFMHDMIYACSTQI